MFGVKCSMVDDMHLGCKTLIPSNTREWHSVEGTQHAGHVQVVWLSSSRMNVASCTFVLVCASSLSPPKPDTGMV